MRALPKCNRERILATDFFYIAESVWRNQLQIIINYETNYLLYFKSDPFVFLDHTLVDFIFYMKHVTNIIEQIKKYEAAQAKAHKPGSKAMPSKSGNAKSAWSSFNPS